MKVAEGFHKGGGSSSPLLVSATRNWDQVFVSRFYNWKAGSWKGAYRYTATYELKPEWPDPNAAIQTPRRCSPIIGGESRSEGARGKNGPGGPLTQDGEHLLAGREGCRGFCR